MNVLQQRAISPIRAATRARPVDHCSLQLFRPRKVTLPSSFPHCFCGGAIWPNGMAACRPSTERNSGKSVFTRTRSLARSLPLALSLVRRTSFPCNRHSSHGNNGMDRAGDSSYSNEIALSDCNRTHDSRRLVADENEYFATSFVVQTLAASNDNVANNPEGTSRKSLNCNAAYTAMELIPSPHSDQQADPRYFPRRSPRLRAERRTPSRCLCSCLL